MASTVDTVAIVVVVAVWVLKSIVVSVSLVAATFGGGFVAGSIPEAAILAVPFEAAAAHLAAALLDTAGLATTHPDALVASAISASQRSYGAYLARGVQILAAALASLLLAPPIPAPLASRAAVAL